MRRKFRVVSIESNTVTVTSGKQWDDSEPLYHCDKNDLLLAEVGDIISAELTPVAGILADAVLEEGVNAARVRPQPPPPPKVDTWNPNDVADVPFASADGFPLSMTDVDRLFREQAKLIVDLTNRIRKLEAFAPKHCARCKSHIEEPAFGTR